MKASVAIATTVLLGPRLQVSDKQLFREVKKTSKAERDKNGKMARSNTTSAARHSENKRKELGLESSHRMVSWGDLPEQKAPLTQTSVTTKHLGINIFLKVFLPPLALKGYCLPGYQTQPSPSPKPPHGVTSRTSKEEFGPGNGLVLVVFLNRDTRKMSEGKSKPTP